MLFDATVMGRRVERGGAQGKNMASFWQKLQNYNEISWPQLLLASHATETKAEENTVDDLAHL